MAYGGAVAGASAAAARRRKRLQEQEEEAMTQYTDEELGEDWEFKIVRSETAAFRRPEVLRHLIEEESRAGWSLLEKLDNHRVRFKRPQSARYRDALLPEGVDPYRTQYGRPSSRYAAKAGVMLALLVSGLLAFALIGLGRGGIEWGSITVVIGIVILALGMLVMMLRLRR
jgi:hypothetical protein